MMPPQPAALGIHDHPTKKLGKRPTVPGRAKLSFADFVTTVPTHPIVDEIPPYNYPMDHNDSVGCCVVAAGDHALQIINTQLLGQYTNWTDDFMLKAYQSQNPGFSSWADAGGPDDNGMYTDQFLSWMISQNLLLGFAKIDVTNPDLVQAAIYLGLAIVTGETLLIANKHGYVWDYVSGSPTWGGHATCWGGFSALRDDLVSWGDGSYAMTDAFIQNQVDEAYFLITQAHVDNPSFRAGFDLAGFATAYSEITGTAFPAVVPTPVPPIPVPPMPPLPENPDQALLPEVRTFISTCHTGERQRLAKALRKWMAAKGYT
jgi:hypothetical protein